MVAGFKSILDLIKAFPDEQACIDHLENLRWNGVVVSPFDA
ncbi:MAG: family transposase, partial [Adhaeribacter sp.]|nr:family transposase [Adhaeribacter sp.]